MSLGQMHMHVNQHRQVILDNRVALEFPSQGWQSYPRVSYPMGVGTGMKIHPWIHEGRVPAKMQVGCGNQILPTGTRRIPAI